MLNLRSTKHTKTVCRDFFYLYGKKVRIGWDEQRIRKWTAKTME